MIAKNTAIIVVGFGSIGKRHVNNLQALGFSNVAVHDPNKEATKEFRGIVESALSEDILSCYKIVFITNPTHLHLETALLCAKAGCHLFIEKPLSHTLLGLDELIRNVDRKKLTAMVACNLRFHPAYEAMKSFITDGTLGRVLRIDLHFDYYLPLWRPGADYQKNYAAKKETGGGILLDDIHEFDLLFWFADFDEVTESHILKSRSGTLRIETEDEAVGIFRFKNGMIGTVSSGYLSKRYRRGVVIVGEKGTLSFEWNGVVLFETDKDRLEVFNATAVDANLMYEKQLAYFLSVVEKGERPVNSIFEAVTVLKNIL